MDINYTITGLILLAAICLLIYLIRKNRKDEKEFVNEMNKGELDPEKHKEDRI